MFVTKITFVTALMQLTLTCGVCRTGQVLADAGSEDARTLGEMVAPMFPDGTYHDFGKVRRGTEVTHAFRIVNTSRLPLEVVRMRSS